jgi:hypothetical protein
MPTFHHNLSFFHLSISLFQTICFIPYCFISQGYLWLDNNELTGSILKAWTISFIARMGTFNYYYSFALLLKCQPNFSQLSFLYVDCSEEITFSNNKLYGPIPMEAGSDPGNIELRLSKCCFQSCPLSSCHVSVAFNHSWMFIVCITTTT